MSGEGTAGSGRRLFGLVGSVLTALLLTVVWLGAAGDSEPQQPQPSTTVRALGSDETTLPPPEATTTAAPATTTGQSEPVAHYDSESDRLVFASDLFSVRYPTDWVLATETLTPGLGWQGISLGTFPLRPGATDCPTIPENALEDMGTDDALVTLFVGGGYSSSPGRVFGPDFPPIDEDFEFASCLDRREPLELRWGDGWDHGRPFYVLVAFGGETSDDTKNAMWSILNGLTLTWPGEVMAIQPRAHSTCEPAAPFDYRSDGEGTEVFLAPVPFASWALLAETPTADCRCRSVYHMEHRRCRAHQSVLRASKPRRCLHLP